MHVIAALFIEVKLTKYILVFLSCGNLCAGLLGSRSIQCVKWKEKGGLGQYPGDPFFLLFKFTGLQSDSTGLLGCQENGMWATFIVSLCLLSEVSGSHSVVSLYYPRDYTVHGILQARILEWVAFPFSRGSSQPRDWSQVFFIAGGFFTSWATREAQKYWDGWLIPSPANLPDPGIEPGSPALQADSLPTELSGKPFIFMKYQQIHVIST